MGILQRKILDMEREAQRVDETADVDPFIAEYKESPKYYSGDEVADDIKFLFNYGLEQITSAMQNIGIIERSLGDETEAGQVIAHSIQGLREIYQYFKEGTQGKLYTQAKYENKLLPQAMETLQELNTSLTSLFKIASEYMNKETGARPIAPKPEEIPGVTYYPGQGQSAPTEPQDEIEEYFQKREKALKSLVWEISYALQVVRDNYTAIQNTLQAMAKQRKRRKPGAEPLEQVPEEPAPEFDNYQNEQFTPFSDWFSLNDKANLKRFQGKLQTSKYPEDLLRYKLWSQFGSGGSKQPNFILRVDQNMFIEVTKAYDAQGNVYIDKFRFLTGVDRGGLGI